MTFAFATCTCGRDVHYAKALLGSIAYFHPDSVIHVLCDADVSASDFRQLSRFKGVHAYRLKDVVKTHGLPLTGLLSKLNLFFIPAVDEVWFADADSVLVGPISEAMARSEAFHFVNAEMLSATRPSDLAVFDRWAIKLDELRNVFGKTVGEKFSFVQSSHFFARCRDFPRKLLEDMLPLMSRSHSATHLLRAGDQGFFNYLANFGETHGIRIGQSQVTVQVGHTPHIAAYDDIEYLRARQPKPHCFIHYVGFSRRYLRRRHEYAVALQWATELYYSRFGTAVFCRDEVARGLATIARSMKRLTRRNQERRR